MSASALLLREAVQGLQGTVSQARFDMARQQFQREAAGRLVPLQDWATGRLEGAADWFSRRSGTEQKALTHGALGLGGLGLYGGGRFL